MFLKAVFIHKSTQQRLDFVFQVYPQDDIVVLLERQIAPHGSLEEFLLQNLIYTVTSCSGCLENQAAQQAHMEPGGCLYEDA